MKTRTFPLHRIRPAQRFLEACRRDPDRWITEAEARREFGATDLEGMLAELRDQGHQVRARQLRTVTGAVVPQWRAE